MKGSEVRKADHPIDALFLDRWSPRAFDGAAIPQADLDTIFDAARWAPSAFNAQPWRFVYAHRDTPAWGPLFDLLIAGTAISRSNSGPQAGVSRCA